LVGSALLVEGLDAGANVARLLPSRPIAMVRLASSGWAKRTALAAKVSAITADATPWSVMTKKPTSRQAPPMSAQRSAGPRGRRTQVGDVDDRDADP
jgi:hypothetical protein